jgi:hypothetical protein
MFIEPDEHAALRARVLAIVSPSERAAVADGKVTTGELVRAARAALRCIEEEAGPAAGDAAEFYSVGPTVSPDQFDVDFGVGFRATSGGSVPPVDISGTIKRCQAEHFDHLMLLYQLDRLADRQFVVAAGKGFVSCLRAGGIDVPGDVEEARRVLADILGGGTGPSDAVRDCIGRYPSVAFAPAASVASVESAG